MADPWYQTGVIYEVHVRAFHDSDADGIGDFRGLTQKLDYLQDLGVTAIWLLPFYPSPLRDDGYDIADYGAVHPDYGTRRDFRRFLDEAHRRNLRVITELVINHTSDQHAWFQRARRAPAGSRWRDFYVWSDTPDRYREARVIFKDTETSNWSWDPVAGAYYWHRFFSHQPDLNYANPEVHEAIFKVLDSWLDMGVDGLRLDAVPYLYEREGTMCENLPETHEFLRRLRARVDERYEDRLLLAEANQWPEDAIAYFGEGDECHMCFHFPLMPRLFMATRMENHFPVTDILEQTPPVPEGCRWAIFLRNHDELTLEMVTDEERDYMYRVYATDRRARLNLGIRRRLAPLLGNNRRELELMHALLFSLPGTPVMYYGDEIGMGDNIYLGDRNGVRTPMQWSADRNAGFSRANPQRLYLPVVTDPEYHYEAVNVAAQQANPNSLWWWMKRMIAQRKRLDVLSDGELELLNPDNPRVLAFLRRRRDEALLVVANLSRYVQSVQLDLAEFEGVTPIEVFGRTAFPEVGTLPYLLTIGPHGFYWFQMHTAPPPIDVTSPADSPPLNLRTGADILSGPGRVALEGALTTVLPRRPWFVGTEATLRAVDVEHVVALRTPDAFLCVVRANPAEGPPQRYLELLALTRGDEGRSMLAEGRSEVVAPVHLDEDGEEAVLRDGASVPAVADALLGMVSGRRHLKLDGGEIRGTPFAAWRRSRPAERLPATVFPGSRSNTSILYGQRLVLKLFRRLDEGVNPDVEVGRFLTERTGFTNMPPCLGAVEWVRPRAEPVTVGVLQGYVESQGDAWHHATEAVGRYLDRALTLPEESVAQLPAPGAHPLDLVGEPMPASVADLVGGFQAECALLGRRTAELHLALASDTEDPDFAPEPFTPLYQRSLFQAMRSAARSTLRLLRRATPDLPEPAESVIGAEAEITDRLAAVGAEGVRFDRIRVHGDYHLGQVLFTGKDFFIIDFEGPASKPLGERRLKRAGLLDVAAMIRSLHHAGHAGLAEHTARGGVGAEAVGAAERLVELWFEWVSASFLDGYLEVAGGTRILPGEAEQVRSLLDAYLVDKALSEIALQLGRRPDWVRAALSGVLRLFG